MDVSVRCSSGTYIRAIARDLGAALGVGGHLTALRRTAVGAFGLDLARTLEQLGEEFTMLPIADAARESFTVRDLDEGQASDVRFGRALDVELAGADRGVRAGRRVPGAVRAARGRRPRRRGVRLMRRPSDPAQ